MMFVTLVNLNTFLIRTFVSIDFVHNRSWRYVSLRGDEIIMKNVIHIFSDCPFIYLLSDIHARQKLCLYLQAVFTN
jgi:hypothetical protein